MKNTIKLKKKKKKENTENESYQLQACSTERELNRGDCDQKDFLIHEAQNTGRAQ